MIWIYVALGVTVILIIAALIIRGKLNRKLRNIDGAVGVYRKGVNVIGNIPNDKPGIKVRDSYERKEQK